MATLFISNPTDRNAAAEADEPVLRLTPSEWRRVLEDPSFLNYGDNRFQQPRRYAGRRVEIVPAPQPS